MCGIAGILWKDRRPVAEEQLRDMADSLAHRGPNGSGTWSDGHVGLAHRRLSIIDLATGGQPMSNQRGTVWITYNGEIYNFRDLRQELEAKGHRFSTSSDTEVVIVAYEEWGPCCVEHLRGMFAFAIADLENRRLFLARDHLGIKPLFLVDTPEVFAFASELQGLRQIPGINLDLDLRSIDQYLRLQYIPAPRSVFQQVEKLAPGHRFMVDFDGRLGPRESYWNLHFQQDRQRSPEEWLEALDQALEASVRAHLVSDVPFGAFLSGGIDSTAIVTYMARILDQPVKTFTIGFKEEQFSELKYAQLAADQCHTEHHVEVLEPDAIGILPTLVRHYGEPFGDSSAIPTYYVSRLAAQSVPMVLSGDGADELFAGYHSYRTWMRWLSWDGVPSWKRALYPLAHQLRPHRFPPRTAGLESWLNFLEQMKVPTRRRLWSPEHRHLCDQPFDLFERVFDQARSYPAVQRAQLLDINTYLPFAILCKVDVASMISSLEVRTPFVDREIAELAASMPPEINFRRTQNGEFEGKLLLKQLLGRSFPETFVRRPKMGFGVPIQRWFGPSGSLREMVHDRLLAPSSPLAGLFEADVIEGFFTDNAIAPLWHLLFLDEWLVQEKSRPGTAAH